MVWEGSQGQSMLRTIRLGHICIEVSMNTVLFVNATIGFSENLFLFFFSLISCLMFTFLQMYLFVQNNMSRPRSESGPILNWSSPDPNFDLGRPILKSFN